MRDYKFFVILLVLFSCCDAKEKISRLHTCKGSALPLNTTHSSEMIVLWNLFIHPKIHKQFFDPVINGLWLLDIQNKMHSSQYLQVAHIWIKVDKINKIQ